MTNHPLDEFRRRATAAHGQGVRAFGRLLELAEAGQGDQARAIAVFLASLYDGEAFPFDLYALRGVDVAISDDMLLCLDALRWAKADLHDQVPYGDRRVRELLKTWDLRWPGPAAADETPVAPRSGRLQARLVSCGDAPGYRDVTLTFEARDTDDPAPQRLELHLDRQDSAAVCEHLHHVHAFAWREGHRPLDAQPDETAPAWIQGGEPGQAGP